MLVITRRLQEAIVLPGLGVTVWVVAIEGNRVRIGVDAPPDVKIIREELLDKGLAPATPACSRPTRSVCVV